MILRVLSFFLLFSVVSSVSANENQSCKFLLSGGLMTGGPILSENIKGSYGKPGFSFHAGLNYELNLHPKWSMRTGLHFQYRQLEYGQNVRKDTLVEIELQGLKGTVPSYYYADAKGKMKFISIELTVIVNFYLSERVYLLSGIYGTYHPYISDKGNVHIQIGEGGMLEDEHENFNNRNYHRDFDVGIKLGGGIKIFETFSIEIYGQRGLISTYKSGFSPSYDIQNLKAYHTYGAVSLVYVPWRF